MRRENLQEELKQQQQESLESPVSGTAVEWSAVMSEQKRFGIKVRALQPARRQAGTQAVKARQGKADRQVPLGLDT